MKHKRVEALFKNLSNDIYYIFVGYIVSEILVKNWKLLALIFHSTEAPLYTNKIYPTPYVPLCGSNSVSGG